MREIVQNISKQTISINPHHDYHIHFSPIKRLGLYEMPIDIFNNPWISSRCSARVKQ